MDVRGVWLTLGTAVNRRSGAAVASLAGLNNAGTNSITSSAPGSRLNAEHPSAGNERTRSATPRETAARQPLCANFDGFGLHASVRVKAHGRQRLEDLCHYITRPALSNVPSGARTTWWG